MKTKNLTIQEAIKSGLPFKRGTMEYITLDKDKCMYIGYADIIAEDWQIKVPEVTITREKLAEAWDKVVHSYCLDFLAASKELECFKAFCKELGI